MSSSGEWSSTVLQWGKSLLSFTKNRGCGVGLGLESEGRVLVGTRHEVLELRGIGDKIRNKKQT